MADADRHTLEDLRKPFPSSVVGQLDRGRGVVLDFVGHAAVTDRLLTVDPEWSWEPLALDEHGLPLYDRAGNLWIKLTILGVTRLGVGDGPDPKQRIGDAIRNAAMRFGVALDLWTKGELESQDPNGGGGDHVQQYERQVERTARREAGGWQDVEVQRPPVVTDPTWLADVRLRIAGCESMADLRVIFDEIGAKHQARELADADGVELRSLIEEHSAELTKQAERPEAGAA